jgi:hypothetical protein
MYHPGVLSADCLTVFVNGRSYQVHKTNPNFGLALQAWRDAVPAHKLIEVLNAALAMVAFTKGKVEVKSGEVFFNGKKLQGVEVERIKTFMAQGLPYKPLLKWLDKMVNHPDTNAQAQLYKFLEHKGLPITEDGCFLAYKRVRKDYTDAHSGKVSNKPGQSPRMKREDVYNDPNVDCGRGLHVGAFDYIAWYTQNNKEAGEGRTVVVKVDPLDAVSVPKDHSFMKLRTCGYTVVCDYNDTEVLAGGLYSVSVPKQTVTRVAAAPVARKYGVKPSGQKFYNVRDARGHFVKK